MRKSLSIVLVALFAAFTSLTAQAQEYKTLPQNAKAYISKHFGGYTINHYDKEQELLDVDYTVYISNNKASFKLEFDKNGNIKDIESKDEKNALPKSVLPVKITQHIHSKFPNARIVEWNRKKNTQIVELDNGIELVFNGKGDFLRIDD